MREGCDILEDTTRYPQNISNPWRLSFSSSVVSGTRGGGPFFQPWAQAEADLVSAFRPLKIGDLVPDKQSKAWSHSERAALRPLFGFFMAHAMPTAIYASARDCEGDRVATKDTLKRISDAVAQLEPS